MKYIRTLTLAAGALGISGLACSNSDSAPKTTLSAVVAPLDLPAATDACYHLTVWNDVANLGSGTQVWDQPVLCASQYGANNGIRFTGICDAEAGLDDVDPSNDGKNAIRLILNDIYKNGDVDSGTALTAGEDYVNPCPAPESGEDNGCVLVADCTQNQDTKIEFNLTVMRQATLGFFDTVVKLQDIFCAAKLDCEDQDNQTLSYLYNASTQADGPTAVLAFTCVGGAGDLFMYLDDIVITCTDGTTTRTATVDPSEGPGNIGHIESDAGAPILFGAAVNTGDGFQGSRYWNVLLGTNFAGAGETCTLQAVGTASKTELGGTPFETPEHTRYPFIQWNVVLSENGQRECSKHPLNGDDGAVSTHYTDIDAPKLLAHKLVGATPESVCPCWDLATLESRSATILAQPDSWASFGHDSGPDNYFSEYGYVDSPNVRGFEARAESSGEDMECRFQDNNLGTYQHLPVTSEQFAACVADIVVLRDDPCTQSPAVCGGSTPACIYQRPGESTCVECTDDNFCASNQDGRTHCSLGEIYSRIPNYQACAECTYETGFACPNGTWCDATGTCTNAQPWAFVSGNGLTTLASAQSACASQGSFHIPTYFEVMSGLTAQFVGGANLGFNAGVLYPGVDPESGVSSNWLVSGWNGAGIDNYGGGWTMTVACAPN
ncbi:MAG: hypothetical protein JNJ59_09125 [Deltaproteobacteria bacterium]|nr:hypothetical protein [Deltaproteobacteria bacterium]